MGRRAKPKCGHTDCEILHLGSCQRKDGVATTPEQLAAARERSGLTQDEAAGLVRKSDGRVWRRWENRERSVDETAAQLFALLTEQRYPYPETA